MTPIAITFLVLSMVLVWGGLILSVVALIRTSNKPDTTVADTPHHNTP
ncbi:MAG: methionine/alanine import family NSS transporter small subunit [Mobilicoccus sp.]|nr:methionine/alanine import family NSS transporter small subunit [Mobilicoccus sp.]